jgi:hypothetical protein
VSSGQDQSAVFLVVCRGTGSAVAVEGYDGPVRGDRVEVTVDVGTGVQTFEVTATRAGRRVEVTTGRTIIEVAELTRGGTTVRTARFMASRVVALVEHPAERDTGGSSSGGDRRAQIDGQGSIV